MAILKRSALGFLVILVYIFGQIFLSINAVFAFLMTTFLGAGLWIYGYNGKVLLYVLIFSFLLSVEILEFFSYWRKNLFQRLWPHILSIIARILWIVFAAIGVYELVFNEVSWELPDKISFGIDLWLLAYNLPFFIFSAVLCWKKYRDFFLKERWGEEFRE